jgi:hypothetical protein
VNIDTEDELTIDEVVEYAHEFGFQVLVHGDSFGLSERGRIIVVGTLEEIVEVIEVAEEFSLLTERYAPHGLTIH